MTEQSFWSGRAPWVLGCVFLVFAFVMLFYLQLPCDAATQVCDRPLVGEGTTFLVLLLSLVALAAFYLYLRNKTPMTAEKVRELVKAECARNGIPVANEDIAVKSVGENLKVAYVRGISKLFEISGRNIVGSFIPGTLHAYFKRVSENAIGREVLRDLRVAAKKDEEYNRFGPEIVDEVAEQ
jgi:hypothetical protein